MDNDSEEILGIDYGEKRIGISISMLNKKIAIPHSIIEYTNKEKAINEINEIVAKNKIKLIVLGIPKTLKNEIGFKAKEVLLFKDSLLEKINVEIDLEDERLSTVQALKSINKNSKNKYVDDSSAAIILNNYLEKLRLNNE